MVRLGHKALRARGREVILVIQAILDRAVALARPAAEQGAPASYIPELAKTDPRQLGACIFTLDGGRFSSGDTQVRFSIQSISKVISLAVALERCGYETVFSQVGMEPSGDPFNSLVRLESSESHPSNPMINSGAIAVDSYLEPVISFEEMLSFTRELCMDPEIRLDERVYRSEMSNISRNRAIAYLLENKGVIQSDVERTLDFYVKMCSLSVTAESLAGFGLLLANGGVNPTTGARLLQAETVQVVKTIMLTCGMYNGSGGFAVRVGIPSKSGVGGGILSVADRKMGIGIFGPSLDQKGNSVAGEQVLEYLSTHLRLHIFAGAG